MDYCVSSIGIKKVKVGYKNGILYVYHLKNDAVYAKDCPFLVAFIFLYFCVFANSQVQQRLFIHWGGRKMDGDGQHRLCIMP